MSRHLQERHRSWEATSTPSEVDSIRNTITISDEEETKLGIPETLRGRFIQVIASEVYDNSRMGTPPAIRDLHGDSPRRFRHAPIVSTYQPPPPFILPHYKPPITFTSSTTPLSPYDGPYHNLNTPYNSSTLAPGPPSNSSDSDVFC